MEITLLPSTFECHVQLDGQPYRLQFRWTPKASMWLLRLHAGAENDDLIFSRFVELDAPMLAGCTHPRRPTGELWATYARATVAPGHADFGVPCRLLYVPRAEIKRVTGLLAA